MADKFEIFNEMYAQETVTATDTLAQVASKRSLSVADNSYLPEKFDETRIQVFF